MIIRRRQPLEPDEEHRLESYVRFWEHGYFSTSDGESEQAHAQPDFLRKQGLKPSDMFLDLGCGYLRGTIGLLDYLEDGHFFGIDISPSNIRRAQERASETSRHKPNLAVASHFEIDQIWPNVGFDMILAASLLTHLWPADVEECIRKVSRVLRGKLFATIFKDNTLPVYGGWCGACIDHNDQHSVDPTMRTQNLADLNFCYNTIWLREAAKGCGLRVKEIGSTEIGQFMLEISGENMGCNLPLSQPS